jgi:glycosyltransferase involved in cell wall biosynthesis
LNFVHTHYDEDKRLPRCVCYYPQAEGYTRDTEYRQIMADTSVCRGTTVVTEYPLPYDIEKLGNITEGGGGALLPGSDGGELGGVPEVPSLGSDVRQPVPVRQAGGVQVLQHGHLHRACPEILRESESASRKKISVTIPCYNDEKGIFTIWERFAKIFGTELTSCDWELIYVDDRSRDETWREIRKVCEFDKTHCKGVRNLNNFGLYRNIFATLTYGTGDAVYMQLSDLEDPPEVLPELVRHWENGHKAVVLARSNTYNSPFVAFLRKCYYRIVNKLTGDKILQGVSYGGLYDQSVVEAVRQVKDIQPLLNGVTAEYAENLKVIPQKQERGIRGKSNLNVWGRYDLAMVTFTSYSKTLLRVISIIGAGIGVASLLFALAEAVLKLVFWDTYPLGIPTALCGMFFLGGLQLFFLGIIGEYILSINNRLMKRPITAVAERVNFDKTTKNHEWTLRTTN